MVMKESWTAAPGTPVDGAEEADAAISAWTADLRGGPQGTELSLEDEKKNAPL